eukprot:CAMPEP_0182518964 /NCGR_PEP_ID=MMETSP1321-20130603/44843_1 /TAXON_ID=91990 /ORGANISM="Bolidomonas sp., Strain RCC1657" /LENGTH=314 /DNA_ID=CAMNT_0024726907 /DNA_START=415 /DNA_END=1356 /DNA_ORIENTATION=-
MKLITSPALSEYASKLQDVTIGDRILSCTLDIFSCKRTNDEKKVAGKLNARQDEECKHLTELNDDKIHEQIKQRKRSSSVSSESDYITSTQRKRSKSNDYENDATTSTSPNALASKPPPTNASKPLPVKRSVTMTSLGDLSDPSVRRLHTDLILTLNATFSDYNFDSLRPQSFKQGEQKTCAETIVYINNQLRASFASTSPTNDVTINNYYDNSNVNIDSILSSLWLSAGEIIPLQDCEVYSYIPEVEGDPFSSDGVLWSFNYFMWNKVEKKILFFTCMAKSGDSYFNEIKNTLEHDDHRILRGEEETYSEADE